MSERSSVSIPLSPRLRVSVSLNESKKLRFRDVYKFCLLVMIDLIASISVIIYFEVDGISQMNLTRCSSVFGSTYNKSGCLNGDADIRRKTYMGIYLTSIIVGILFMWINSGMNEISYEALNNPVIKISYLLRNVCLFNLFNFTSTWDINNNIIYEFANIEWWSFLVALGISILINMLVWLVIYGTFQMKQSTFWNYVSLMLQLIVTFGLIFSIIVYIIIINTLDLGTLTMFNVRGPGLQSITNLQAFLLLITILEYYEYSKIGLLIRDVSMND